MAYKTKTPLVPVMCTMIFIFFLAGCNQQPDPLIGADIGDVLRQVGKPDTQGSSKEPGQMTWSYGDGTVVVFEKTDRYRVVRIDRP